MLAVLAASWFVLQGDAVAFSPNFWSRDENAGNCRPEGSGFRVVHSGTHDWSVNLGDPIPVRAGSALALYLKSGGTGAGKADISFVLRKGDQVVDWMAGRRAISTKPAVAKTTLLAAEGITSVQPRLTGDGPIDFSFSNVTVDRLTLATLGPNPKPVLLKNKWLKVRVNPADLSTRTTDLRNGKEWRTQGLAGAFAVTSVRSTATLVTIQAVTRDGLHPVELGIALEPKEAGISWHLKGDEIPTNVEFPGALETKPTSEIVLPMNMGIRFAAGDAAVGEQWMVGYGGHGLCMAFFGQLEDGAGALHLIGNSDDFALYVRRTDGRLASHPLWEPQDQTHLGYPRRLRTLFFDRADVTRLALRYRQDAKARGLVKTLAEKAKKSPNVQRVAQAVNLWTWSDKLPLAQAFRKAGIKNVLWSGGGSREELLGIQKLGFVPGRYDIYQDVMDPAKFPDLPWLHPDWVTAAWPNDLIRDASGDWIKGWVVQDKQGRDVPCGALCDVEALKYATQRIPADLKQNPYEARFLDTTTASPYRQCFDPRHPMTRTQSRVARMDLLQYITDLGLVTGSETGHEASVPHLTYYEGMMSLGPYRVADAGTDPPKRYDVLPEPVVKFQLGEKYRIPLWQLVYGDCTVSGWYWGDSSDKNLATWRRRDLWNILYGSQPLYFTDLAYFQAHRDRYVQSYHDVQAALSRVAMHRMVEFRVLTPDRSVQQTRWDNGTVITVNFGSKPFRGIAAEGYSIK